VLPSTLQFVIAMIGCAMNERMLNYYHREAA
jgi:hypothetical protein